jgi:hypothetical protein
MHQKQRWVRDDRKEAYWRKQIDLVGNIIRQMTIFASALPIYFLPLLLSTGARLLFARPSFFMDF